MNFLLELRETARVCPNVLMQKLLRDAADDLNARLNVAHDNPTTENMQALNGAWIKAVRVFRNAPPLGGNGSGAGRMRVTEEMRQAA